MEPGLYLDIPSEEYHSGPGISRSDLVKVLRSPAHYKYGEVEETPAMTFGEDFHVGLLQPELFAQQYVILPADCRTGSGPGQRSRKEAFEARAAAKGQTIIKDEDHQTILGMIQAIHGHPEISALLKSGGQNEVSCYWYDYGYPDILLKCRLDHLNTATGIILDPKSTTDARPDYWTSHAYKLGYHIQAGMYLAGVSAATRIAHQDFRFVVVEKKKPYGVQWYRASEEFIMQGQIEFQRALALYAECLRTDKWPCYTPDLQPLDLPPWKKRKNVIFE